MTDASRYRPHLRRRYRVILGYAGLASLPAAGILALPLLLLPVFPREIGHAWGFLLPALGLGLLGGLLWKFLLPRGGGFLTYQEGAIVVLLVWTQSILFAALPFWLVGGLAFTPSLFESTSGWTTTGLSVVDVTHLSPLLLFLRSLLQFAGGAGLAILMLSALAGPAGTGLSSAEGRAEQLVPQVRRSARLVLSLYLGYALAGCFALWLAGMDGFDAVNHAFTAISTGGFSTRTDSIGAWGSGSIEGVVMVLMLLGNINFLTAYAFWRGHFRPVWANAELRLSAAILPLAAALLFFAVTAGLYPTLASGVRIALFEATSALTTTGFSTVGYGHWPDFGWLVLIALMTIGGGTGSTAGGLKQFRVYALVVGLLGELRRLLLPRQAITAPAIWVGEQRRFLNDGQLRQIGTFFFLYLGALLAGTAILCAHGYPLRESLFEFASALGTVGLSCGITAADAPATVLWAEMAGMFFGRLEFLVLFTGMARLMIDLPALLPGGS